MRHPFSSRLEFDEVRFFLDVIERDLGDLLGLCTIVPALILDLALDVEDVVEEAKEDERLLALFDMGKSLPVVHVKLASGPLTLIGVNFQRQIVAQCMQQAHFARMLQDRQDGTSTHPDSLLAVRKLDGLDASLAVKSDPVVPVVPLCVFWERALDGPDELLIVWHLHLGTDEYIFAKQELGIQGCNARILREFKPHRSYEWVGLCRSLIKHRVNVVNQIIAHIDGITDHLLDAFVLEPGLSVLVIDLVVRPEEWIEHAKLVHHDPEIFGRLQLVTWDVSATERVTSYS